MKVVKVKISELKPDKDQPRKILEDLKELGESIILKGQLTPIIVTRDLEILDGHRRYFACKDAGIPYLNAYITDDKGKKLTPFLKKARPFAINVERTDFKPYEMAESIYNIYWNYFLEEFKPTKQSEKGYSEFSKQMGISKTAARDIIEMYEKSKKSKVLDKALKEKKIPITTLKDISVRPKQEHGDLIKIAKKEHNRVFMRDRIRDETLKTKIRAQETIHKAYITRIKIISKNLGLLLNEEVLKKIDNKQRSEIQQTLKKIYNFYRKL